MSTDHSMADEATIPQKLFNTKAKLANCQLYINILHSTRR